MAESHTFFSGYKAFFGGKEELFVFKVKNDRKDN
jgi:hypothetical protein